MTCDTGEFLTFVFFFVWNRIRTGAMTAPRSVYTRFYIASKKYILYPVSRFQISRKQIYA